MNEIKGIMKRWIFIIITIFFCKMLVAKEAENLFNKGNEFYAQEKFDSALYFYNEVLARSYESAELYYNMGNAWFKKKNYAKSILYYEKAKLLGPSDENIKHNLSMARINIIDKIDEVPEFIFKKWVNYFLSILPANGWAVISLLFFIIALASFVLYFFSVRRMQKKIGFWIGSVLFIMSIFCFVGAYKSKNILVNNNSGIIMTPTVTVKSSPSLGGKDLFIIHEGTKVYIQDEESGWREIKISDGKQGWIKQEDIELI